MVGLYFSKGFGVGTAETLVKAISGAPDKERYTEEQLNEEISYYEATPGLKRGP